MVGRALTGVVEAALGNKVVDAEAGGGGGGAAGVDAGALGAARVVGHAIGGAGGEGPGRGQSGVDRCQVEAGRLQALVGDTLRRQLHHKHPPPLVMLSNKWYPQQVLHTEVVLTRSLRGLSCATHEPEWEAKYRKGRQADGGAVEDEEEPEELVEALAQDVLPHLAADQLLVTAMRLFQQQPWRGWLSCQRCTHTATSSGQAQPLLQVEPAFTTINTERRAYQMLQLQTSRMHKMPHQLFAVGSSTHSKQHSELPSLVVLPSDAQGPDSPNKPGRAHRERRVRP